MSTDGRINTVSQKIAKRIINACMQVRAGERIHISSWGYTVNLASNMAIECYTRGAVPLITLLTDDLFERIVTEIPVETLAQTPTHELAIADTIDGYIKISGPADPTILERASDDRYSAFAKAGGEIGKTYERRNVRQLNVHLGKVTRKRAEHYRFSYSKWKNIMENALLVDYSALKRTGEHLMQQISSGENVRVVTDHTDLKFRVGEDLRLDDGVVSKRDVADGNLLTNLPGGLLELFPQEKSGEGVFTADTLHRLGKTIKQARLQLEDGMVTSVTAERNVKPLHKVVDRVCTEQPVLNRVGIGLNPEMKRGYLFDELCRSTVSIAIGSKTGKCVISWPLREPTLYVDGMKLIERGKISTHEFRSTHEF
ncbi:MAG: aminopeptidase [Candidatus Korarchaeota archaeon]|nr:aminopeptidase [Candidatus Korarchaeota archaeon]NIU82274.1 aminopeptidase [Candidatus Thorarchaeota archaeon]NIW12728.1 aminopeptidase [Candidatus Thorarchaeota archaeon]NIW50939.1 aminopeptidase [Candidatus Korarchaeota archaeon]